MPFNPTTDNDDDLPFFDWYAELTTILSQTDFVGELEFEYEGCEVKVATNADDRGKVDDIYVYASLPNDKAFNLAEVWTNGPNGPEQMETHQAWFDADQVSDPEQWLTGLVETIRAVVAAALVEDAAWTPVPKNIADRVAEDVIKWVNDAKWGYVDLPRDIIEAVLAARGFQRLDHEREETLSASVISDRQTGDLIHIWTGPDGYEIKVHTATVTSGREWTRIDATNGIREFACGARMIFGDDSEDEWREELGSSLADDDDDDDRIMAGDPTYVTLYKDDDFEVSVGTWPSGYMQYVTNEYRCADRHVGGKWEFVEAAYDPREFRIPIPVPARAAMIAHWEART